MAIDTKLKLSDKKFEQLSGETLTLSGNTIIQGALNFTSGYTPTGDTSVATKLYTDQNGINNLTFENGISRTSDTVSLGGSLTGDTVIDTGSANFTLQGAAYGSANRAQGTNNIVLGEASAASGNSNIALGYYSYAYGCYSIAMMGGYISANSICSLAINGSYVTGRNAISIGNNNRSCADAAITIGCGVTANAFKSIVIQNNSDTSPDNFGADAVNASIFGGCRSKIESGNTFSTLIGGTCITLTGTLYTGATVLGGNVAIYNSPSVGISSDSVLVRDSSTGIIRQIAQSGLTGGGGSPLTFNNGLTNNNGIVSLGGVLTGDTVINTNFYGIAFGCGSVASGYNSFAEGCGTTASGNTSHAEGSQTTASSFNSHAEGRYTTASGSGSHAEGFCTIASSFNSHAEGGFTEASGNYSHAEGRSTTASGYFSHAEGNCTITSGNASHSEGCSTTASASGSHAEGRSTTASGFNSHAEGYNTTASGNTSHAEGNCTIASGNYSHAEGRSTTACGQSSHAEGSNTRASSLNSHAEGYNTTASGNTSHAQGRDTTASGNYSHAQGRYTTASGNYSHAGGRGIFNKYILAEGRASFNHSYNSGSQILGHGALANSSVILGGINHNIASGNTNAAIIGGNTIKLTGTDYIDTTAVGNLAIMSSPAAGDASTTVMVRDAATGIIQERSQADVASASDERLKNIIQPITSVLEGLSLLNSYEFQFNDKMKPESLKGKTRYGLIAQELEKVFPHVVENDYKIGDEIYKSVRYTELIPILVKAIQELREEINLLKK